MMGEVDQNQDPHLHTTCVYPPLLLKNYQN